MRHPSRTDEGQIAMVIDGYPGKMQIAGRVVRLGNHETQNFADGRVFERFTVKLYDTSTPYGDRYQDTFKLASMYLELCNISDSGSYCYEHGVEHSFGTTWDIPTPPKFSSVEEADAWMERRQAQHQVITDDFTRADGALGQSWGDAPSWGVVSAAFDPNTTPIWGCPNDPCEVHGCVGPHPDMPAALPPGSYSVQAGPTVVSGQTFTVAHGAITYTIS